MDPDHWDILPEVSWSQLEQLYMEGQSKWRDAKRSILQRMHGSDTYRRTATFKDELMAHLRWSTRILQADSRVPMPVEWDSRHIVALIELGRVLNEHARSSSDGTSFSLPPVTTATCLAQLLVFFKPGGVLLRDVSLSPYCVVDKAQYYRLLSAALVHVDATHLITNMTACLPDCLMLEEHCGSAALASDLVLLTLTSHALYVGFAWLQKSVFIKRFNYYSLVTVGFSGVVFGLKVWAGFKRGGVVHIWGVPVPARFSWVPALALTHLCVPEASFPAHIAGVVAGILRAYCLEPVLVGVRRGVRWTRRGGSSSSGTASGGQLQQPAASQAGSRALPQQQQQQQLRSSNQQQAGDWRLLHRERWLQQQQEQQQVPVGSSSSPGSRHTSEGGSSQAVQQPQAAAAGRLTDPSQQQRLSAAGSGWSVRALLLDVGLQITLAATAAGLYFVLSTGERSSSSRLKAAYWRR